ncbi:hypothetical protein K491DRAFT_49636 [Lophiostoma macrostomum CBS 122681]|uniref:Uncharacterized protein n=1 Tax=Lophiostoma macrostomum CBS 122681 TaxID=1314788 RepID=A0A6A6T0Q4_9PLEO|nr:hypothetical protein K491DRAFT_49636 [Lophiostoma macrostomum CBS 122681]
MSDQNAPRTTEAETMYTVQYLYVFPITCKRAIANEARKVDTHGVLCNEKEGMVKIEVHQFYARLFSDEAKCSHVREAERCDNKNEPPCYIQQFALDDPYIVEDLNGTHSWECEKQDHEDCDMGVTPLWVGTPSGEAVFYDWRYPTRWIVLCQDWKKHGTAAGKETSEKPDELNLLKESDKKYVSPGAEGAKGDPA